MTGIGCWDDTCSPVIPACDAGIKEFYQVGEYKSYVKIQRFMENLIPVSSTGMIREGATEMTEGGDAIIKKSVSATWMIPS